jgi:hypothetical protein
MNEHISPKEKLSLDPPEQLSFSSSSSNSALFNRYYQIWKPACTFMLFMLACMQLSIPIFCGASLIPP